MSIEVNIDGEAINQAVAAAIIDSTIGAEIKKQITLAISGTWDRQTIVKNLVTQHIQQEIRTLLQDEYADQIKNALRKALEEEGLEQIIKASSDALIKEINRERY